MSETAWWIAVISFQAGWFSSRLYMFWDGKASEAEVFGAAFAGIAVLAMYGLLRLLWAGVSSLWRN